MKIDDTYVFAIKEKSEEPYFSHSGCENCSNGLGTNVFDVDVFMSRDDIENDDPYEFQLCPECLYQYHMGDAERHHSCKDRYFIFEPWKLVHLDTCLPDYFSGYHKPVLAIIAYPTMSADQFIEAVVDEYNQVYDHLTWNNEWPDVDDAELKKMAAAMLTVSGDEMVFTDLEVIDEDEDDYTDSVMCYLSIE